MANQIYVITVITSITAVTEFNRVPALSITILLGIAVISELQVLIASRQAIEIINTNTISYTMIEYIVPEEIAIIIIRLTAIGSTAKTSDTSTFR